MECKSDIYSQQLGLKHEMLIDDTKEINKECLFLTAILIWKSFLKNEEEKIKNKEKLQTKTKGWEIVQT